MKPNHVKPNQPVLQIPDLPREDQLLRVWPGSIPAFQVCNQSPVPMLHKALPWVLEDYHISRNTLPALLGRLLATLRLPEISIVLDPPREDQLLRVWPGSISGPQPISDTNVA